MNPRTVPRTESPAYKVASFMALIVTALLCMIAIPFAIVGILLFNIVVSIKDRLKRNRAWCWFVGRRVAP